MERGQGAFVYDADGTNYDSLLSLGRNDPRPRESRRYGSPSRKQLVRAPARRHHRTRTSTRHLISRCPFHSSKKFARLQRHRGHYERRLRLASASTGAIWLLNSKAAITFTQTVPFASRSGSPRSESRMSRASDVLAKLTLTLPTNDSHPSKRFSPPRHQISPRHSRIQSQTTWRRHAGKGVPKARAKFTASTRAPIVDEGHHRLSACTTVPRSKLLGMRRRSTTMGKIICGGLPLRPMVGGAGNYEHSRLRSAQSTRLERAPGIPMQ